MGSVTRSVVKGWVAGGDRDRTILGIKVEPSKLHAYSSDWTVWIFEPCGFQICFARFSRRAGSDPFLASHFNPSYVTSSQLIQPTLLFLFSKVSGCSVT